MKIHNVVQSTKEWHALRNQHFSASEAAAVMGVHKYMTRDELLKQYATGVRPEVTPEQQRLFDKGHASEEAARPIAEKILDDDLFPVTATDDNDWLLASMDGLTMLGDVGWEHKLYSAKLAEQVKAETLDMHYVWQLEQQALVTGCTEILFMTSDGTEDNCYFFPYKPDPKLQKQLVAGWKQFEKDLAEYKAKLDAGEIEKPVDAQAEVIKDLPAITYKMNGLALTSDFDKFKEQARLLIEKSKKELVTDDDFATAETLVKMFKTAEDKLSNLAEQVIGEVSDIDSFIKDLKHVSEEMRQARLATDKLVKSEKESRKLAIRQKAEAELNKFIEDKNELLEGITLPAYHADFAGAMKGLKTMASIQSAVNDCLANAKVDISQMFDEVSRNLKTLDNLASDYKFLFADLQQIISKEQGDFEALVKARIADHKEAEAERIKREEEAKANRRKEAELLEAEYTSKKDTAIGDEGEELPVAAEAKKAVSTGLSGAQKTKPTAQDEINSIVKYITDEVFPLGHIKAIAAIVYAFNESPESEKEIFEFTESLKSKYGKAA